MVVDIHGVDRSHSRLCVPDSDSLFVWGGRSRSCPQHDSHDFTLVPAVAAGPCAECLVHWAGGGGGGQRPDSLFSDQAPGMAMALLRVRNPRSTLVPRLVL